MPLVEPLSELFTQSKVLILDFAQLNSTTPAAENIQLFFKDCAERGINPRLPQNRQKFNDSLFASSGYKYLIGRYGEDRAAMLADTPAGKEGRTIHLAVDIFTKELEPVFAPCDGEIIISDYEPGFGEYGNYLIIKPADADYFIFFGHLSKDKRSVGKVSAGETIARLGDYMDNENGGWSRHLHIQILKSIPTKGATPNGYSSAKDFPTNSKLYPNPLNYFPRWELQ